VSSFKVNIAIIITLLLWASAFVGIRIGLTGYTPGALALLRFLVASFCMIFVHRYFAKNNRIPWKSRLQIMLLGMAGIGIYNICLNVGEMTVSAGVASFVIGLIPVMTIFLSIIFLKERPNVFVWLGMLISFIGLLGILFGESSSFTPDAGVLIILVSALMGGIYNVSQKKFLRDYHPAVITAWVIWGGTFMLLWFAPDLYQQINIARHEATFAAIYMGIFPAAVAYVAWSFVLDNMSASIASAYLYALPVLSTAMGFFLLGEIPSVLSLSGGIIALSGALLASRTRQMKNIRIERLVAVGEHA